MAIGASPVQTAAGDGTKSANFGALTVAGNAIIVLTGTDGANDVTAVTDDNGNTYTEIVKNTTGSRRCSIWLAVNITGGLDIAITMTTGASAPNSHIVATEWNTTVDDFEVDQSNTADSSAQTNHPKGSITTAHADTLVVGVLRVDNAFSTTSRETGYSVINTTARLEAVYKVFSSTATTDADITTAASESGGNAIASLNEIVAGGGGLVIPIAMDYYRRLRMGA